MKKRRRKCKRINKFTRVMKKRRRKCKRINKFTRINWEWIKFRSTITSLISDPKKISYNDFILYSYYLKKMLNVGDHILHDGAIYSSKLYCDSNTYKDGTFSRKYTITRWSEENTKRHTIVLIEYRINDMALIYRNSEISNNAMILLEVYENVIKMYNDNCDDVTYNFIDYKNIKII